MSLPGEAEESGSDVTQDPDPDEVASHGKHEDSCFKRELHTTMIIRPASEESTDEPSNTLSEGRGILEGKEWVWSNTFQLLGSASVLGPYLDGKAVDGGTDDRSSRCIFTLM